MKPSFKTTIYKGNINVYLGRFDDPTDAARVYDAAARALFGSRAVYNFPDEEGKGDVKGWVFPPALKDIVKKYPPSSS